MDIVNHTSNCPFCSLESEGRLLAENELVFAILDRFPVNPGHVLVIPKFHTADYFHLPLEYQVAVWKMMNEVREQVESRYQPHGYNIGVNVREAAGQTVSHVHVHLIPRYTGDVAEPRGGVRGVIPDKRTY